MNLEMARNVRLGSLPATEYTVRRPSANGHKWSRLSWASWRCSLQPEQKHSRYRREIPSQTSHLPRSTQDRTCAACSCSFRFFASLLSTLFQFPDFSASASSSSRLTPWVLMISKPVHPDPRARKVVAYRITPFIDVEAIRNFAVFMIPPKNIH